MINPIQRSRYIFVTAMGFLLLLSVFTYLRISSLIESARLVNHTTRVVLELEKLIGSLKDAETGQRGYLITGDTRFLEPYNSGLQENQLHLQQLTELTKDNPQQQQNLQTTQALIEEIKKYFLSIQQFRKTNAAEMLTGKILMDNLRKQVNKMIAIENNLMQQREGIFDKQVLLAPVNMLILRAAALIILIVAYWQLHKALQEAQQLRTAVINQQIALEKNKALQQLFMQAPVFVTLVRVPGFIVEVVNEAALQIWGKSYDEVINKPFFEISPELREVMLPVFDNIVETGKPVSLKEAAVCYVRNGQLYTGYFNITRKPVFDADGKMTGIITITTEVTESVTARKKAEESEHRFQTMVSSSPSMISILRGKEMVVEIANDAILDTWGKGRNIAGKSLFEVVPEIIEQGLKDILLQVFTTGIPYHASEFPIWFLRNGTPKTSYYTFVYQPQRNVAGEIDGVAIISSEVTPEAELNLKLKESEKEYRELADSLPQLIWKTDAHGEQLFTSARWQAYSGLDVRNADTFRKMTHPGDWETSSAAWVHSLATGSKFRQELRLKNKDGSYCWFQSQAEPVHGINGKIEKWIGSLTNIDALKSSEATLQESKEQFSAMADNIPNLAWMADADGWIYWYNKKWYEYTGTTPKQMEGWGWQQVHDAAQLPQVMEKWQASIASGQPFEMIFPLKGADGSFRQFLTRVLPVKDGAGKVLKWFGSNTDITAQMEAEEKIRVSEMRFRQLAETLPQLVLVTDEKGRAQYISSKWDEYCGIKPVGPEEWKAIVHPDDQENLNHAWLHNLTTGTYYTFEIRLKSRTGLYRWFTANGNPVTDANGSVIRWVSAFTDIHKMKEEEQRKSEFIKMVSHELKTPVTSIKGYVQLLLNILEETDATLPAPIPVQPTLQRIDKQVLRLTRLITEMLDLSRIEENKLELRKEIFDINHLVSETVQDLLLTHTSHTMQVRHYFKGLVTADKDRIQQVLINLINNSIKYSPQQKTIEVQVHKPGANQVSVSVKDYGIGIATDDQKRIFERFYRVDGKSEKAFSGFGIGLFVSNEIIERHAGSIRVESELGEGAVFTFTLPQA